jgi:hypothetical protein
MPRPRIHKGRANLCAGRFKAAKKHAFGMKSLHAKTPGYK